MSPSSKTTRSWVAERVSWNGCDMTTEDLSGKKFNSRLDSEELTSNVYTMLGEQEEVGLSETPGVEDSICQHEVEFHTEEQSVQGVGSVSPISKELNFVWKVKGTSGMSWDGQNGKLKQIFGQIVADKHGKGDSGSVGVKADGFMGLRDDDVSYEA
jgi:hypothetical protein